tara:strand:- start:1773 stop:3536 length:1764 start_codon:yes stop_codon:yes gene_type:complete
MLILKKKNFPVEVLFIFRFIIKKYFKDNNNHLNKLILHFFKSHFLVILFIKISFYYINIISLICYKKKFINLNFNQFNIILSKISGIKFLQSNKIIELFHAIVAIHLDGKENSQKIKIDTENQIKDFYENIVIGSGPGGSITANELKKANKDILLIEKGSWFKHFNLKHPGEEFFLKWKNGGLAAALGNVKIQYSSAECFGGGSEINSGLYHEPDQEFLDEWSKKFNTNDMHYNELKKFIDTTKEKTNVSYLKQYLSITKKIINSAKINNWKIEEIPRWCLDDDKTFIKKSMTETYLKEYLKNNGQVSLETHVNKIYKIKNLWKIEFIKNKKKKSITCNNIFLCCGSIENLKILKDNNLVKKNNKISFHPMIKVVVKFPEKVNKKNMEILTHQLTEFFPDFLVGSAASGLPFLKISAQHDEKLYSDVINNWENMLIFHSTFSIGKGDVIKVPFLNEPIIKYQINKNEINLVKKGLEKLCKLLIDADCDYIYPIAKKSQKLNKLNYKEYVDKISDVTDLNYSTVHILGGVPMGENKEICTVDSYGKLYGFKNFYINDSSLICNKLLKNPQGTVMAVALRNVTNFLKQN